mgnify:CR=1 FL=1
METPMLNTFTPDKCCGARLAAVLITDALSDAWRWNCPVCEQEWRAELHQIDQGEGMKHWAPHSFIQIFNGRPAA